MNRKFYVTTPIYYVNDKPHIGHACTTVVADMIARYHKTLNEDVFFLTGTDEHGAKVAEEAQKAGLPPQQFANKVSKTFEEIWPKLGIKTDFFIRTTNPQHKKIVQDIIHKIYKRGDIYKARYEGHYCVGCEKFITETELVNGYCPLHPKQKIQKQSEENYFFKLSKYAPQLIKAIENPKDKNHYKISPPGKREEVLSRLKAGVDDISISRANVSWGIPVPWDKNQTIYVWFDALLNYYSALKITNQEKFWPADLHLIGKEILWFHVVIWEAMLLAAGISLPKEVFAHSFYMVDGQKMSKSLGNVITPEELIEKFGVDGTRYLIASSFPFDNDSDVSWKKFTEKYNADLANGLGNFVARVEKMATETDNLTISSPTNYQNLLTINPKYKQSIEEFRFGDALSYIWGRIHTGDLFIEIKKPWEKTGQERTEIINTLIATIQGIATLLLTFLPKTAEEILERFAGPQIKSGPPLFPRLS